MNKEIPFYYDNDNNVSNLSIFDKHSSIFTQKQHFIEQKKPSESIEDIYKKSIEFKFSKKKDEKKLSKKKKYSIEVFNDIFNHFD